MRVCTYTSKKMTLPWPCFFFFSTIKQWAMRLFRKWQKHDIFLKNKKVLDGCGTARCEREWVYIFFWGKSICTPEKQAEHQTSSNSLGLTALDSIKQPPVTKMEVLALQKNIEKRGRWRRRQTQRGRARDGDKVSERRREEGGDRHQRKEQSSKWAFFLCSRESEEWGVALCWERQIHASSQI